MVATVKCDTITEASNTGTANISLDSSGNVTIGNNLTVNGTTTQTGSTTFTGPTYFPDGSVSAPSIAHTGDTNCGLYFGTDTIYAATAGTNALTIDSSQNMTVANTLVMGSSFKRNRIINGNMQVWQRGTSTTSTGVYLADRWLLNNITSASQQTDVPSGAGFQYSIQFANTSATYPLVGQRIEAVNCADLVGKSVTLSFWAKNVSGSAVIYSEAYYANSVDNFTTATGIGNFQATSANPSSSWTYYTGTIANFPAGAANGIQINIVRNNGSAATTLVTGVQLEVGSIATPYERQIYSDQLAQCQRYYYRMTSLTVYAPIGVGRAWSTSTGNAGVYLPVPLRTSPTLNYSSLSHFDIPGVVGNPTAISNDGCTSQVVKVGWQRSGVTTGTIYQIEFGNGTGYWLDFSSEL